MVLSIEHAEFDDSHLRPPHSQPRITLLAVIIAVLMHTLLIILLVKGVQWNQNGQEGASAPVVSAQLWSIEEPQPTPHPPPRIAPLPTPAVNKPEPLVVPKANVDAADIVLERLKKKEKEHAAQIARDKALKEKREKVEKLENDKREQEKLEKEKIAKEKALKDKQAQVNLEKERLAKEKIAKDKALKEKQDQEKADQERLRKEKIAKEKADKEKAEQVAAKNRAEALKRLNAKAQQEGAANGANNEANGRFAGTGKGNGQRGTGSADSGRKGPSSSYEERVRASLRRHIVFSEGLNGAPPVAEIEVKLSVEGTILDRRLVKSSGNRAWDEAALRAIDRAGVLPRDIDGKAPTDPFIIEMKPY